MKILITGASGFVGSHFANLISDKKCVVRKNSMHFFDNTFEVDRIDGRTNWEGAFDNIDTVVHLAGVAHTKNCDTNDFKEVNVEGTVRLAEEAIAANVRRFIFVSSIGVNGNRTYGNALSHQSRTKPYNSYSNSKFDAEIELMELCRCADMELVIIRPTLVYGVDAPGSFSTLVKFVKLSPVLPFGLVNNRRSFISVENLSDLLKCCCYHPNAAGKVFLASEAKPMSIKQFTQHISSCYGLRRYQLFIPIWLMRLLGRGINRLDTVNQLVSDLEVDSSYTYECLGWVPPYDITDSLKS